MIVLLDFSKFLQKCEYTDMELVAAILDRLFFLVHFVVLIAISVGYVGHMSL